MSNATQLHNTICRIATVEWPDMDDLQNFESTSHFDLGAMPSVIDYSPAADITLLGRQRNNYSTDTRRTQPTNENERLQYGYGLMPSSDLDIIYEESSRQILFFQPVRQRRPNTRHPHTLKNGCSTVTHPSSQSSFLLSVAVLLYFCTTFASSNIMLNSDQIISDDSRPAVRIKYPPFVRINHCYSCMSAMYEPFFRMENSHLARFFYEPRNFTAHCDDSGSLDRYRVGAVPCRAICLTLTQEFTVMGRKTGKLLTMRGCATSLSRFGFYNRTFALFDQYDLCREVLANELFRYDTDSQLIRVCSCLGDRCNGAAASRSSGATRLIGVALVAALSYALLRQLLISPISNPF